MVHTIYKAYINVLIGWHFSVEGCYQSWPHVGEANFNTLKGFQSYVNLPAAKNFYANYRTIV